jgi:hypothetical protein
MNCITRLQAELAELTAATAACVAGVWQFNAEEADLTGTCECGMVIILELKFALGHAIGSHTCSLEALACVRPITFLSGAHYLSLFGRSMTSEHRRKHSVRTP